MELDISYLRSQFGDAVEDMTWNLFVKPDATVDTFVYQVAATLKSISNHEIAKEFNSFALSLVDNRPLIGNR